MNIGISCGLSRGAALTFERSVLIANYAYARRLINIGINVRSTVIGIGAACKIFQATNKQHRAIRRTPLPTVVKTVLREGKKEPSYRVQR
jgi:hypothetical protein